MSCNDCEKFEEEGNIAYYRWGTANVGMIGCKKHLREIFNALDETQNEESKNSKIFKERLNKNTNDFDLIIVDMLKHINKLEERNDNSNICI